MNHLCDVEATQTSHLLGRVFLNSVLSAILGLGLLLLVACYVFVEFFVDPMMLRSDRHFDGTSSASAEHPVNQPANLDMGLDSVGPPTEEELCSLLLRFYTSASISVLSWMECLSFQSQLLFLKALQTPDFLGLQCIMGLQLLLS